MGKRLFALPFGFPPVAFQLAGVSLQSTAIKCNLTAVLIWCPECTVCAMLGWSASLVCSSVFYSSCIFFLNG